MTTSAAAVAAILSIALIACAVPGPGRSSLARLLAPEPRTEYIVHLDEPQTQTVRISMVVRGVASPTVDIALPVWRPGRYEVLDPAGTIHTERAVSGSPRSGEGAELPVEKVDKTTWRITTRGADELTFSYTVYANALADRTRHVDATHAFLSGSAVFPCIAERRGESALVRIEAPDGWHVATGLPPAGDDPMVLLAADYDTLVDSPLEIGTHDLLTFDVDGTPHEIAIWGDWNRERYAARLPEDFAKIVRAERDVFGDLPYDRYVFLLHVTTGAGGGTEHLNSTIMQTGRGSFRSDASYRRFLSLVSHEMFHTWNVKQLRPAGLKPYDYTRENYTDLLWLVEGTTSYYDDLVLVRSGINKPKPYTDGLAGQIGSLRQRPGARVQTLARSSFDAWIKFNHPNPDNVNTTISFYDKGAMASLVLDLEIRRHSENRASLDTVMRDLYQRFPLRGPGFTEADVREAAARAAGTDMADLFETCIHSTDDIDFERALLAAGLELKLESDTPEEGEERRDDRPYLGFTLSDRSGIVTIASVLADGPAWAAGLNADDELLGINGSRARGTDPIAILDSVRPGDALSLLIARRDRVLTIDLVADARPAARWRLNKVKEPTDLQRCIYAGWLGQPWDPSTPSEPSEDPKNTIDRILDDWHAAAAAADIEAYFAPLDENAVFLGTDATERWPRDQFRAFCEPHFAKGKAWTFVPRDRTIDVRDDWCWFDELLDSEHMGVCRGSGVLHRSGKTWKITQYNLGIPVPNALADEFIERIRAHENP